MSTEKCQCKNCGQHYFNVRQLTTNKCSRGNNRGGYHELYEGSEKDRYTCKHCGLHFQTITMMSYNKCANGGNKGRYHEPAL